MFASYTAQRLCLVNIERANLLATLADERLAEDRSDRGEERLALRKARRAFEAHLQHLVPPGPWDNDLDMYPPGKEYTFDLGDGYEGMVRRSGESLSWNVYVRIPKDHPMVGKDYNDLYDLIGNLTYGRGNMFGIDHGHSWDRTPHVFYHDLNGLEDHDRGDYTTYEEAVEEAKYLKEAFKKHEKKPEPIKKPMSYKAALLT